MTKLQQVKNRLLNRIDTVKAWLKKTPYTYTTTYSDGLYNAKEEELRELIAMAQLLGLEVSYRVADYQPPLFT